MRSVLADAWRLASPYFVRSEERWSARLLLAAVIAANLVIVAITVQLNFWQGAFFNTIQTKDGAAFEDLILLGHTVDGAFQIGFVPIVTVYVLVATYRTYLRQWLQIRWRAWMTGRLLAEWLDDRAYYTIGLQHAGAPDNPDQRIAEDLRSFTDDSLLLSLELLSQVVTLASFATILYGLSGAVEVLGVSVPGSMLWLAVLYALAGSLLVHWVGKPLAPIEFEKQRVEADFRFGLIRVREGAEGVALQGGEAAETRMLRGRFARIVVNVRRQMSRVKRVNALGLVYNQAAVVFPYVIAGPRFFSGAITFGDLTRVADAFGTVQSALSWFIDSYPKLAIWRATVSRLTTFHASIAAARATHGPVARPGGTGLALERLTLALPDGRPLLEGTDLVLQPGRATLLSGRSGTGKSTLFRAIAGIWPFGGGAIARPAGTILVLPQRPYLPLGTLRDCLAYPHDPASLADEQVRSVLADVGLAALLPELDADQNWVQRLSGGEQQRLALARAVLARPDWLLLDEATASLDPEAESELYAMLRRRLPGTTILSIAHRPELARWHDDQMSLADRTLSRPTPAGFGNAGPTL